MAAKSASLTYVEGSRAAGVRDLPRLPAGGRMGVALVVLMSALHDAGGNDACLGLSAGGGATPAIHTPRARSNQFPNAFLWTRRKKPVLVRRAWSSRSHKVTKPSGMRSWPENLELWSRCFLPDPCSGQVVEEEVGKPGHDLNNGPAAKLLSAAVEVQNLKAWDWDLARLDRCEDGDCYLVDFVTPILESNETLFQKVETGSSHRPGNGHSAIDAWHSLLSGATFRTYAHVGQPDVGPRALHC